MGDMGVIDMGLIIAGVVELEMGGF